MITSQKEIKAILIEEFFNNQGNVTKLSENSTLDAIFEGIATIAKKSLKEIALVKARLFPQNGADDTLDLVAEERGISPRFEESASSTYVRIVGNPGTVYNKNENILQSTSGITFLFEENFSLNQFGYSYAKVKSQDLGDKANVNALTITKLSPTPIGHAYIINEYQATGGRDAESDLLFLKRILEGPNILAKHTNAYLSEVFNKINSNVLRVIYQGKSTNGNIRLALLPQNGVNFTQLEFDELLSKGSEWFSLVDSRTYEDNVVKVDLVNVNYHPIDISFRASFDGSVSVDEIRKTIQVKLSKLYDLRTWNNSSYLEWEDIMIAVKSTEGINYLADQYFIPRLDVKIPRNQFPRIRGFQMLDLNGNIISDLQNNLNPFFYPAKVDFNFQNTVLNSIF